MKKSLSFAAALLGMMAAMAQNQPTFVSTTPGGRCVLIEEYTGVNCTWCPAGHKIANEVIAAHPDSAFAINIHQGGYAAMYTTQWGNALANQTGLTGYPAGTVNRHVFQGSATSLSRDSWPTAANRILAMSSPCNVATQVEFDVSTRELTITVEVYYTSDASNSTNLLNIALLQDNVLGPQTGAQQNYPEMMVGNQYRHNHMLRHLITGQWGDTIHNTSEGSFFTKQYTYTIPEQIGDVHIGTNFLDLSIVTFVTETRQEVLTATSAFVPLTDPLLASVETEPYGCDFGFVPVLTVMNPTNSAVSNVVVNVEGQTYTLARTIASGATDTLHLAPYIVADRPGVGEQMDCGHELTCELVSYVKNGNTVQLDNVTFTTTIADFTLYGVADGLRVQARNDTYGGVDTRYTLTTLDGSCDVAWSKEPSSADNGQLRNYTIDLNSNKVYRLDVEDLEGDGMSSNIKGVIVKTHDNSTTLASHLGNYGEGFTEYFYVATSAAGIDEAEASTVRLYPNPVSDRLYVEGADEATTLEVLDLEGRTLLRAQGNSLSTEALGVGVYMLRLTNANGTATHKFVKQ